MATNLTIVPSATVGSGAGVDYAGGPAMVTIVGTWNGNTVTVDYSPDGSAWIPIGDSFDGTAVSLSANGQAPINQPLGQLRATTAGVGNSPLVMTVRMLSLRVVKDYSAG